MMFVRYLMIVQLAFLCLLPGIDPVSAGTAIIDERSSGTLQSSHAGKWRLVTDEVMGGRSSGELVVDNYLGKDCLRMRGLVSTENNGGFVQMALELAGGTAFDASVYEGVEFEIAGNGQGYNLHLRTSNLWLPWQSYRASFVAGPEWQTVRIPFVTFKAYRTASRLKTDRLVRIGLVAIGRDFQADLCLAALRFYRNSDNANES